MKRFLIITLLLTVAGTICMPIEASDVYVHQTHQDSKVKKATKIALAIVGTGIGISIVGISALRILRCYYQRQRHPAPADGAGGLRHDVERPREALFEGTGGAAAPFSYELPRQR